MCMKIILQCFFVICAGGFRHPVAADRIHAHLQKLEHQDLLQLAPVMEFLRVS